MITNTLEARLLIARLIRIHRPRYVCIHPDHRAVTEIVTNGVFYARLPKWDEVKGAESALDGTEPHEIERLSFARCRMEPAWRSFDFAVDISDWYERKRAAITRTHRYSRAINRVWSSGTQPRTNTTAASGAGATPTHSRREARYSSAIPRHSRKCHSVDHRAHFLSGFRMPGESWRMGTRTHCCSFGSYKQARRS